MRLPLATINDPLAPRVTSGRPQPPSRDTKKVKVKAHMRRIKVRTPKPIVAKPPPADPFAAQAHADAGLIYGPKIRGAGDLIRQSQYNQIKNGAWYADYEKQLQSQATAQNQAAANVAAALAKTFGNPAAAQTGNPQADALAAQAAQSQSHLGQAFAGTQSQMALDTANRFATGLIPGAQLADAETQQNEANRQQQLRSQLGDVKSQAGVYELQQRQKLAAGAQQQANADRTYQLQLAAANNAGLLSDVNYKKALTDLSKKRADLDYFNKHGYYPRTGPPPPKKQPKGPSTGDKINQAKLDFFNRHGYWPPTGPPKPTTPKKVKARVPTESELRSRQGILDVKKKYTTEMANGTPLHEIADNARKHGVSEAILAAGADLATKGHITPNHVRQLRSVGVRVPKRWTTPGR